MKPTQSARQRINDTLLRDLKPAPTKFDVWDDKLHGFGVRTLPSGSQTYYCRWWDGGNWRWYRLGSTEKLNPTEARKEALKVLGGAEKGIDPTAEKRAARKAAQEAVTLGEFVEGEYFKTWLSPRKSGAATLARLKACFPEFWNLRFDAITPGAIEKWRAARLANGRRKKHEKQKDGCAKTTVNRDVAALRACLSKALEWGVIQEHPLSRVKPLRVDSAAVVRYLSPKEEKSLLEALDIREDRLRTERDSANVWRSDRGYSDWQDLRSVAFADYLKPLVLLSLHTGLRRGEAFSLTWEDIDLDRGNLTVQGKAAKSGKTRHVPLNSYIAQVLRDWHEQSSEADLVFPSPATGKRLDNVNTSWEAVLSTAKIKAFRWHDMRHHFASKLVMAGVDLNTVRDLLGHSSITMTLRYAHLAPENRAAAVERLVVPEGKIIAFEKKRGRKA